MCSYKRGVARRRKRRAAQLAVTPDARFARAGEPPDVRRTENRAHGLVFASESRGSRGSPRSFRGLPRRLHARASPWSETYVAPDLTLACPWHLDTRARLLIQRQHRDPSAIELLFEEVVGVHVSPSREGSDSLIIAGTFLQRDGIIYWADVPDWDPAARNRDGATWLGARRLCWRDASDWLGSELRYGGPVGRAPLTR